MKLVMIICPENRRSQLAGLFEEHGVHAFTELDHVIGAGVTGKHLDTQAWPGSSAMLFTVVADDKKDELLSALRECRKNLFAGEGMKVFVLPAEEEM